MRWSLSCHQVCLRQATTSPCSSSPSVVLDLSGDLPEYHDFKEVFSKTRANSLLPHLPYYCAIKLLPGMSPPKGHLCSLSAPEREAMETFFDDSLANDIINPLLSLGGVRFFFMEKKEKTLRPCIDYWGINDITFKNRYPLPAISSAFKLLQIVSFFRLSPSSSSTFSTPNVYCGSRKAASGRLPSAPLLVTTNTW